MRIFVCAGEPSGDIHGANLLKALQERHRGLECVGFGGEKMAAAGCKLIYPLCQLAVMWFARVLAKAPTFLSLLSQADRFFRHQRPDAVVLIDYPGFNWWLARRAHFHKIPVFYFVPPQLWGWAGWRVKKMQRFVDHVLCTLPFEESWYQERGVQAHYVGHPFYDELPRQRLDAAFLAEQRARGGEIVGFLPGSRTQEIERNLSTMVRAAARIHQERPETRFLVACFRPSHQKMINAYLRAVGGQAPFSAPEDNAPMPKKVPDPFPPRRWPTIETHVGRTPEIIELSRACMSVSGSVTLELLYRGKPSVMVYRIGRLDLVVCNFFKTSRFISLVNLLANKELFPEFLTDHCVAGPIANHILGWLNQPESYAQVCRELAELRRQVAQPGACDRAADFILNKLAVKHRSTRRAA
jgi:lipid-A-disaccharide synthase